MPAKNIFQALKEIAARATGSSGLSYTRTMEFAQTATATSYVGSVVLPAGAWLGDIIVVNNVLWTPTGAATLKIGDTDDDDGFFIGVNLKATDLLVGEVLSLRDSTNWGGKNGAYLVAATGQQGPAGATVTGLYYGASKTITATITVGTPANTAGRTKVYVRYSVGDPVTVTVT